jgi:hypothetical protein
MTLAGICAPQFHDIATTDGKHKWLSPNRQFITAHCLHMPGTGEEAR